MPRAVKEIEIETETEKVERVEETKIGQEEVVGSQSTLNQELQRWVDFFLLFFN